MEEGALADLLVGVQVRPETLADEADRKRPRVIGSHPPAPEVFEAAGLAELLEPDRRRAPRS